MTKPERAAPPNGQIPHTEASRARLVLSANAAETAERAAGLVPIGEHELAANGTARWGTEWVDSAAAIAAAAQLLLRDAVVAAHLGGASWDEIGSALDVTPDSAQEQFDAAVRQFRLELHSPEDPHYSGRFGEMKYRLHPAAREPRPAAADLDDWVRRHHDPTTAPELAAAPVSGGLAQMEPTAVLGWVADVSHQLWIDHDYHDPPLPARLELAELTLAAWEQIAADRGGRTKAVRNGLAYARHALDKLRKEAESTTTPEQSGSSE
jgi:hypothetical protein